MLAAVVPILLAAKSYFVTPQQLTQTRSAVRANAPNRFSTPTEAAYAASLRYKVPVLDGEIGTKIYADTDGAGAVYYSYGQVIYSVLGPHDTVDQIVYDDSVTDGHSRVIGLWHEHAIGSTWFDLWGHYDAIRQTHQTIWTTIGDDFFVQFFDGTMVEPAWTASVPAIAPVCRACV